MSHLSGKKQDKKIKREIDLWNAIEVGNRKYVIKLLRKGVSADCQSGSFGRSPLSRACQLGYVDIADILIRNGASVNSNTLCVRPNVPPLISAMESGQTEVVNFLLQRGASVKLMFFCSQVNSMVNPIHFACIRGQKVYVKTLVDNGCEIEQESSKGQRPVHYAVIFDRIELIEELSNNKANLNAKENTPSGNTPLHLAVTHNSYTAVKCLVQLHVDIHAVNEHGQTAMDIAKANNCDRIYALLQQIQTDIQYKLNIEKITLTTADTQQRLAKLEDATSRLEDQLPSRIRDVVDHRFRQLMLRCSRRSLDAPFGAYPDLDTSHRSDYASLEALCEEEEEELPALIPPPRAKSCAQLPLHAEPRRRSSDGHEECSERIRKNYKELLSDLKAEEIIPILFQSRALTSQDFDYLHFNCKSDREKNVYILRYVVMRGANTTFQIFRQSLKETDQIHLFDLLSDDVSTPEVCENVTPNIETSYEESLQGQKPNSLVPTPLAEGAENINGCHGYDIDPTQLTATADESRNDSSALTRPQPVEHVFRLDACEDVDEISGDSSHANSTDQSVLLDTPLLPSNKKYRKNKMRRRWHTLAAIHFVHTSFEAD